MKYSLQSPPSFPLEFTSLTHIFATLEEVSDVLMTT